MPQEKKPFIIGLFTEDIPGLLNRVSIVFSQRKLNIASLTVSESEVKGVHRYTVTLHATEEIVQKVVRRLEKIVEVIRAFYFEEDEIVSQEIALYKLPTSVLLGGQDLEIIVRKHHARILTVEQDFVVIEKTGHRKEIEELFEVLEPLGLCEFVRSGRVAITKPMKTLHQYLQELDHSGGNHRNTQ